MAVLIISAIIVIVDQISKLLVRGFSIPFLGIEHDGFYYGESIHVIGDFLQFTFVENPGIAFGIDIGIEAKLFLTIFTFLLSSAIFVFLYKNKRNVLTYRIGISLVLGGAIGNLIDRMFYGVLFDYAPLFYGKVVDFINFEFPDFTLFGSSFTRFPIFNIADSAVTIGVIIILLFAPENNFRLKKKKNGSNSLDENNSELNRNEVNGSDLPSQEEKSL